jgi:hypothetical protein
MDEIQELANSATTQEIIDKINELVRAVNKDLHGLTS